MRIASLGNCRLLWFLLFIIVWCLLRIFWLDCDPGVPSVWEYGYNATDEGYYLDGGKEKLLWGTFTDLARTEAFTYGFSAGTHYLSYLAHLVFGLSTWIWRLPFFLLNLIGWSCLFLHLSRRRNAFEAGFFCLAVSSLPLIVAYERTASNDVLIGSFLMMSYSLAAERGKVRLFAAAVVAAAMVLVKPSVFILLPFVLAGVLLGERRFPAAWLDVVIFMATALVAIFGFRIVVALAVLPDATREGCSIFEIVRTTTTHYPLPSILAFTDHFRGLSAFPRDPSGRFLGFFSALLVAVPLAAAVRELFDSRNLGRIILFLSVPAYVAAVSVMNTIYTHYFIPAIVMLPVVLAEIANAESKYRLEKFSFRVQLALTIGIFILIVAILSLQEYSLDPRRTQTVYSRIYNFPSQIVWSELAAPLILLSLTGSVFIFAFAARERLRTALLAILPLAVLSSTIVAYLPAISLAPYMKASPETEFWPMVFTLTIGFILVVLPVISPGLLGRRGLMAGFTAGSLVLGLCLMPNWRKAAGELLVPGTHRHAEVAAELAQLLPKDAIVVGERSNQMLMSLPIRTATTFAANSNPIPVLDRIRARYPNAPLFALIDSQHSYAVQHYRDHAKKYRLDLIKSFKMPSFATGALADVHLCRIQPLQSNVGPMK